MRLILIIFIFYGNSLPTALAKPAKRLPNNNVPFHSDICGDNSNLAKAINDFGYFAFLQVQPGTSKYKEILDVKSTLEQLTKDSLKLCDALKALNN